MRRSIAATAFMALVVCLLISLGCARTPEVPPSAGPVLVDATADKTSVVLAKGADLVVSLEGNPTTGFDWKVPETLPAQLTAKDDSFETAADPGVVGVGGIRVFTYTAAEVGTGVLELEYVRAWEKGVPPELTFSLTVVVK